MFIAKVLISGNKINNKKNNNKDLGAFIYK